MPRPWRLRFVGAKYHLTQRGNGGQEVFFGREDRERFLEQLDECLERNRVILYAYCLMPNHYHLFVETPMGNVQRFMQRLNTAYAMYFRYKHGRPGHCWQGRYGAKLVRGEAYILGLCRYIHLNPVKVKGWAGKPAEKVRGHLNAYEWSSYRGYAGLSRPEERIDYRWLDLMGGIGKTAKRKAYRKYVQRMACDEDAEYLKAASASGYAIGDDEYLEEVAEQLESKRMERTITGDVVWPEDKRPGIDVVEAAVLKEFGISRADLHCHGRHAGTAKAAAIELCCRLSGRTQREVGQYFGYGTDAGVCKQRQRFAVKLAADDALLSRVEKMAKRVAKSIVQV